MQKKSTNATLLATGPSGVPDLDAAYRATAYQADCPDAPGGRLLIRIGGLHPMVDAWLDQVGVNCWSYLTAANPASRPLPVGQNARRCEALRRALAQSGKPFLPGQSIADDGAWPPEASFLVGGLAPRDGAALAMQYGQNAFIHGCHGGVAELIWLPRGLAAADTMP